MLSSPSVGWSVTVQSQGPLILALRTRKSLPGFEIETCAGSECCCSVLDYVSILNRIRWLRKTALSPCFPKPEIVNQANSNMKSKAQNLPQLKNFVRAFLFLDYFPWPAVEIELKFIIEQKESSGFKYLHEADQNHAIFLAISFCRFSTQQCVDFYVVVRLCFVKIPWDLFFLIFRSLRVFLYSAIDRISVFSFRQELNSVFIQLKMKLQSFMLFIY